MTRRILPLIGVIAALWAAFAVARTHPARDYTEPPNPPPMSMFTQTVAATGLVEASTENIAVGTPVGGIVSRVFVTAGDFVRPGDLLFELDSRHLRAELNARQRAAAAARARATAVESRLADARHQLEFVEQVTDKRAVSSEEVTRRRSAVLTAAADLEQAHSETAAAEAIAQRADVEIQRSRIRSPIDAEVLQVKVRAGEYAPAASLAAPLMLLGRSKPLHVRVDVDEHEGWRVREGASAVGHLRGNANLKTPLQFVRVEPFVVPKRSLTGDNTERVDTRVLQIVYRVERDDLPLFIGQQLDVFINTQEEGAR